MAKFTKNHPLGELADLACTNDKAAVRIEIVEFGSLIQLFAKKGKEQKLMKTLGFETNPGEASIAKNVTYLPMAPGQWLVLSERKNAPAFGEELAKKIVGLGHVSEQTASRIRIRLSGERVRELMSRGCRLDLHPESASKGFTAQTVIAQIGVTIHQRSDDPIYDLYVYAGFARSFWHWLTHTAEQFGYEVVV